MKQCNYHIKHYCDTQEAATMQQVTLSIPPHPGFFLPGCGLEMIPTNEKVSCIFECEIGSKRDAVY